MARLFPKLPTGVSADLVGRLARLDAHDAFLVSAVSHPSAIYAPVGGNRVQRENLEVLQSDLRRAATGSGYPSSSTEEQRRSFDATSASILFAEMDISAGEAADPRLWSFMACVLVPDIVRWRFPGGPEGTPAERFMGGARGTRNTIGRTWWRAHLLGTAESVEATDYLTKLGEDELVQLTERPGIAGSPRLARQLCGSFLQASGRHPEITRSDLMRDAMKRVRRLASIVSFDGMTASSLDALINETFAAATRALGGAPDIASPGYAKND